MTPLFINRNYGPRTAPPFQPHGLTSHGAFRAQASINPSASYAAYHEPRSALNSAHLRVSAESDALNRTKSAEHRRIRAYYNAMETVLRDRCCVGVDCGV